MVVGEDIRRWSEVVLSMKFQPKEVLYATQPLLENDFRGNLTNGQKEFIPVLNNPLSKNRSSSMATVQALKRFVRIAP